VSGRGRDGGEAGRMLVTATVGGRHCGVPVNDVRDVLGPRQLTPIPLAPPAVAGTLNLRGRIVTAVDLRIRMAVPAETPAEACMGIVVEHGGHPYSLIVDAVGEVVPVPDQGVEPHPPSLEPAWRDVSRGVCRQRDGPILVLDVDALLDLPAGRRAA
jgi:purine-binding chemotaxis protein CheW